MIMLWTPKVKMNSERTRNSTNWTKNRLVSEFHDGKQHGASSQRSGFSCANGPLREEPWLVRPRQSRVALVSALRENGAEHHGSLWTDSLRAGEAVLAQFRVPFCCLGRSILRRAAIHWRLSAVKSKRVFQRAPSWSNFVDVG